MEWCDATCVLHTRCAHTLASLARITKWHHHPRCPHGQPATQPPSTGPEYPMKYTEIRVYSECLCGWVLTAALAMDG